MGLMKKVIVDTNVLLRFLVNEKSILEQESTKILNHAEKGKLIIKLNELVIAECIWVMMSHYKYDKQKVVKNIKELIVKEFFEIDNREIVYKALLLFGQVNLSWVDCYLYCQSKKLGLTLVTFDEKLVKLCK